VEFLKKEMELKTEAYFSELESLKKEMDQEKHRSLEENNRLREIVQSQNHEVLSMKKKIKISQNKICKQNQQLTTTGKPIKLFHNLFQQLMKNNFTSEDVVHDVISQLLSRKYFRKHLTTSIQTNIDMLPQLADFFGKKMYGEIRQKFRGWICLQELDMSATVSFRAFDIIQKIEFAEDEKKKYRRGLYPSQFKLGRICRQLENYGKDFLPYELTDYSVKFCVKTAVKFLMEKYGLWERTMNKEIITMAATVDGGDLAWGLTQVSAGVKLVDQKTRDPTSG
jgi:hypothetical protein